MTLIYCVDIDGTICNNSKDGNYISVIPNPDRIAKINNLYDEGHYIIYLTARGMSRYKNSRVAAHNEFYNFTYNQLRSWGCRFHELHMGKPAADIYVDDKGVNDNDFFN